MTNSGNPRKRGISAMLTSLPLLGKPKRTEDDTCIGDTAILDEDSDSDDANEEIDDADARKFKGYVQGPLDRKFGQRAAFPVTLSAVNVTTTPNTVQEYLAQVRQEAEALSRFQGYHDNEDDDDDDDDDDDLVYYHIASPVVENSSLLDQNQLHNKEFRAMRDDYWEYRNALTSMDEDPSFPTTSTQWKAYCRSHPIPSHDAVARIDAVGGEDELLRVLVLLGRWLGGSVDGGVFARWTLHLLAALETPLHGTGASVVRAVGIRAAKAVGAAAVGAAVPEVVAVLAVVGVEFGQRDLLVVKTEH